MTGLILRNSLNCKSAVHSIDRMLTAFSQNAENADHLTTHVDLAVDLLKCLYDSDRSCKPNHLILCLLSLSTIIFCKAEDKKIFCQLLGKIALCEMDEHKVCILFILIANVQEVCRGFVQWFQESYRCLAVSF